MIFEDIGLRELPAIADEIILLTEKHSVFCFYGDLAAGKTTLIKHIGEKLALSESISSPTYPIINEYHFDGKPLYHIDLYRLKSIEEALDIGLEEYLFSSSLCFIEWPDNFESMLPKEHIKIKITKFDELRRIEIVSNH